MLNLAYYLPQNNQTYENNIIDFQRIKGVFYPNNSFSSQIPTKSNWFYQKSKIVFFQFVNHVDLPF